MNIASVGNTFHEVINMVKGISRQVIVVHSPEPRLFEQAIFILKEDALKKGGVTDDVLLQEARRLMNSPKKRKLYHYGPAWACGGALMTGIAWLLCAVL